jgi:hypothetical protein
MPDAQFLPDQARQINAIQQRLDDLERRLDGSRLQLAQAKLPPVSSLLTSSVVTASSYTFALNDAATVVEGNSGTAQTFTVPPNSSVAFPVGTVMEVFQYGAGQVTIAAAAGVTLRSDGGKVKTAAQYASIGLRQRATNEWVLTGDLA